MTREEINGLVNRFDIGGQIQHFVGRSPMGKSYNPYLDYAGFLPKPGQLPDIYTRDSYVPISHEFEGKVNNLIAEKRKGNIRDLQKELYSRGYVDMYDTLHNIRNKDDVKALQSVLAKKGYLKGSNAIDGIIGKNTRDALKRFASDRKSQDLDYLVYKYAVDGKYGKKTEAALRRMSTDIADNGELPDEYIEKYARPSMFERLEVVDNPLPSGQQYIARRERNASMLGLPQVNRQIPGYTDLSDINGIGNWRVNPNVKSAEVVDDIDYIEDALDDMNPDMYL